MESSKEKATLNKRIEELIKEKEKSKRELFEALKKSNNAKKELEELIKERSKFNMYINNLAKENEELSEKLNKTLKEKGEVIIIIEKLKTENKNLHTMKEENIVGYNKKITEMNSEKVYLINRIVEVTKELEQLKKELMNKNDQLISERQEHSKIIDQLNINLYEANDKIAKENKILNKKIEELNSELNIGHTHKLQNDGLIQELKANNLKLINELNNTNNEKLYINNMLSTITKERNELIDTQLSSKIAAEKKSFSIANNKNTGISINTRVHEVNYQIRTVSNVDIETLRKRIEELEEENEKVVRNKEYHLRESNEILKKYSLDNARLTVKLQKTLELLKDLRNALNKDRTTIKSLLSTLNNNLKQSYQHFKEKVHIKAQ